MKHFIYRLKILISFALRDVSKSRFVLLFTIISLSAAFTAVFLSAGILEGFKTTLEQGAVDTMGHIIVYPSEGDDHIKRIDDVSENIKNTENVESISVKNQGYVLLEYEDRKIGPYTGSGVNVDQEITTTKLPLDIVEGRFLKEDDSKGIVIGLTLADALVGLEYDGIKVPIGEKVKIISTSGKAVEYTVVGILDGKTFVPNWITYFNKKEMAELEPDKKDNLIVVKIADDTKLDETKLLIQSQNPDTRVRTWVEESGYIGDMVTAIQFVTGSITALLMVAVFVVMSVIIFINVYNHRRQIGILKSMGASNRFVVSIYLFEAFIYSILSFIIGFLCFMYININSNANPIPLLIGDFHTQFKPDNVVPSIVVLILATLGGSYLPAMLAAKTKIADVLRDMI